MTAAELSDVRFRYAGGEGPTFALDALALSAGETVLLTGESGSGKSTLLGLICGVLAASSGRLVIAGEEASGASGARRDRIRADHIGYIFQHSNLLPYLSPVENVLLAGQFSKRRQSAGGGDHAARKVTAQELLDRLGVQDLDRPSSQLSVGQQQRVAAARALFGEPTILVADEPTAALDDGNRDRFFDLFLSEARRTGAGVLVVSHDLSIIPLFDRHLDLSSIARWEDR